MSRTEIPRGGGHVDSSTFRTVLGHFASGVVIVTGATAEGPVGFTCQSFFSVSLDPPLVAVAPGRTSTSWPRIHETGRFCANVLTEDQEALGRSFAVSGGQKFTGVGWAPAPSGCPVLTGCLAWIDCTVAAVHDAGDHLLVLGRVEEMGYSNGRPLLFYRGGFGSFQA
jgi:3-hydroxy-9,10-secoandrosta-1,3,5(10)-triene-9,17-dione monooxygenase reductase component